MKSKVSIVEVSSDLKKSVKKAVDLIGGFKQFDFKDKKILVKLNFNTADPFPASSDALFIKAVIELINEENPKEVIIGESSQALPTTLSTKKVLKERGIFEVAKETNAKVVVFDEHEWIKVKVPQRKYLKSVSIPKILREVDKIVLLPCMKTHRGARFTLSLKLAVGFMKGRERLWLHLRKLEEKIAELSSLFTPDLIIMDGRKCFVTLGPEKGEVREPNLILASRDRIAIDVEAIKILKSYKAENKLDMPIWEFPQIKRAVELNLGAKNEDEIEVVKD